jgi:PAS domain S-box-containing protein
MHHPVKEKLLASLQRRLATWLVAAVGCVFSISVAATLHQHEVRTVLQEVERRADLRHALLLANFREFDEALFSLRILLEGSENVSTAEFARAAELVSSRVRGVQALEWTPVVKEEDMTAFLARCRTTISPDFSVREGLAGVSLGPAAGHRPERAPITYIHPLTGNEAALGYDTFSSRNTETLARARAHPGKGALSSAFPLVQGGEGLIYCIYVERDSKFPPPEGGPGFLQAVLRLDLAFSHFLRFSSNAVHDTLFVDITDGSRPLILHSPGQPDPRINPELDLADFNTPFSVQRDVLVGGRHWRIHFRPTDSWIAERRSFAPLFSLLNGLLLTGVCGAYLNTLRTRSDRIRDEVAERTAQLAESRALLEAITDHNPNCIWVKDADLRYQLANLSFASACGVRREDLLGRRDEENRPAELGARTRELDRRILASGESVSFEDTCEIGGRRRTYLVTKFPLQRDGLVHAVVGIGTDITALREAEARHLAVERKLLETQKLESLGILAGGVAHDFNNLLTGILGHANLLRAQLPPGDPAQPSLEQIELSAHRAADLCHQMLAYAGRGRFSTHPIDLGAVVRDTTSLLHLSLARRARLNLDLAPALPAVDADTSQIRQIVMNLVLNASEALVEGRGEITVRTRAVAADPALFAKCVLTPELPAGKYVVLEVEDNGCGMPDSVISRVFEPFYTTKFTGRGLGLAAVLGIVRGHHGALQVLSRIGQGTTFRVYFPASAAPAAPENAAPSPAPARLTDARGPRFTLLLVDDDQSVRETTAALLQAAGHRVDSWADGETALRDFANNSSTYHAGILDLTMPGIGGLDLMHRLRELRPGLPVLIISGHNDEYSAGAQLAGVPCVRFLPKPFTLGTLDSALAELMRDTDSPAPPKGKTSGKA